MKSIIKSILDLDRYKLAMSQFIYFFYPDLEVEYEFTCRTKDEKTRTALLFLTPYINSQFVYVSKLRPTFSELLYLKNAGIFKEDYLNFLNSIEIGKIHASEKEDENGLKHLSIVYRGKWAVKTLVETYALSIVNELYSRFWSLTSFFKDQTIESHSEKYKTLLGFAEDNSYMSGILKPHCDNALKILENKIDIYKHHPQIKFFEFGTRRRFSADLQEKIVLKLQDSFHKPQFMGTSQFLGTSNEYLAFKHGMKAGGTSAHEMDMAIVALHDGITKGDKQTMLNSIWFWRRKWAEFYGYDLSVCLTDTFGSEWFFKNCPEDIAHMYSFREDSAVNLFQYTDMVLDLYKRHKIHSNDKVLVHSNGLTPLKIANIANYKPNEINKVYGQGTDLSCDVGNDYKHISIVIKLSKVLVDGEWISTVKLSDNLAKAIGPKEQVERYKRIFGYTNELSESQTY